MVSSTAYTTSQYLCQAQKAIDKFEFELAIKILKRSFDEESNSLVAFKLATCLLEMKQSPSNQASPDIQMEIGEENIKEWLGKALRGLDNGAISTGAEEERVFRWQINLSLAQLSTGMKAVEYYESSVAELDQLVLQEDESDKRNTLIRHQSTALCALCEIFMTDCCDAPEAESKCMEYITKAQHADPQNPEVFSTLASILLSRCMPEKAREALVQNLDLWYIDPHSAKEDEGEVDLAAFSASWPSFEARLVIAKLLVEVEEFRRAVGVIETLFVENDEWWEVWYLFGICYMRMAEMGSGDATTDADGCMMDVDEQNEALEPQDIEILLADAKECFEKILRLNEKFVAMGDEDALDPSIIEETQELLKEVETLAGSANQI